MAKKIKVYLQYPWSFPDSPYYKYLITNPPKNIEYLNTQTQKGVITSSFRFGLMNKIKNVVRELMYILRRPNIIRTKKGDYDVIHCAHCLSSNKQPWITDAEHYWNFASSGEIAYSNAGRERIKKMLKSPYCKRVLPWTKAAKESILKNMNDAEIEKKTELVYPAIPLPELRLKKNKKITLLFVGRYFYGKGGLHALEAFDRLSKKYNIECIFVSETPKQFIDKYSGNKRIKFHGLMPQKKLFELYSEADIFVYPGYSDTFGFALIEAMSFSLAVVTVDGFARKEIVSEGKTGFVIERKKETDCNKIDEEGKRIIEEIVEKTSQLIKNKKLLQKMSKSARKEIEKGKFSMKERNKKLERIYQEAIK